SPGAIARGIGRPARCTGRLHGAASAARHRVCRFRPNFADLERRPLMPRVVMSLLVLVAGLLTAAGLSAQPRSGGGDLAANAALKYWQAFAHLPPRNDEQQRRIGDWRTTPLDATARRLVADGQNSLIYL